MSSTVKITKAKALAGVQALIAGTQKHLPTGTFTIGNATYTAASLVAMFGSASQTLVAHMNRAPIRLSPATRRSRSIATFSPMTTPDYTGVQLSSL